MSLASDHALRLSDESSDGPSMLEEARRRGWEGVMAKRADAPYRPGVRTRDWLKLKLDCRQEFVVGGWTEPRNSREHFGALLLGYYDNTGTLVYAGHTGTESHARRCSTCLDGCGASSAKRLHSYRRRARMSAPTG
jgi:ATP-dependent DNA ligase